MPKVSVCPVAIATQTPLQNGPDASTAPSMARPESSLPLTENPASEGAVASLPPSVPASVASPESAPASLAGGAAESCAGNAASTADEAGGGIGS